MLYPFKFKPIFKEILWGGHEIHPFKGLPGNGRKTGESWELSDVEGNKSVVANGVLEGKTIDELIATYGERLLGRKVMIQSGATFPLLIKFIDARDRLSIQVHPNDELAGERHNSFGKTEMWYVIKAAEGADLYSGFSRQIDADEYVRRVEDNTIMEVLQRYEIQRGDVFFLPAGRVHAIGAGCFIAEIQQTSNITYRIYDYGRTDADGNERELHTELAKDAIDYTLYPNYRTGYTQKENVPVELARCRYFTTRLLSIDRELSRDLSSLDSFAVYICMEGETGLSDNKGNTLTVKQGETLLIPADTNQILLKPSKQSKLLEIHVGQE